MIDRQSHPALSVFTDKLHFQAAGARKALATKWTTLSTPASLPNMMFGSNASDQSMLNPETPSKSLLGTDTSNSMLFSPPSILKVTNSQLSIYLRKSVFITTYLWPLSPIIATVTPLLHNEVVNNLCCFRKLYQKRRDRTTLCCPATPAWRMPPPRLR